LLFVGTNKFIGHIYKYHDIDNFHKVAEVRYVYIG